MGCISIKRIKWMLITIQGDVRCWYVLIFQSTWILPIPLNLLPQDTAKIFSAVALSSHCRVSCHRLQQNIWECYSEPRVFLGLVPSGSNFHRPLLQCFAKMVDAIVFLLLFFKVNFTFAYVNNAYYFSVLLSCCIRVLNKQKYQDKRTVYRTIKWSFTDNGTCFNVLV